VAWTSLRLAFRLKRSLAGHADCLVVQSLYEVYAAFRESGRHLFDAPTHGRWDGGALEPDSTDWTDTPKLDDEDMRER
jgi:hypothetical protein